MNVSAVLALAFEPNMGQADATAKFLARGNGYTLFLTPDTAVLCLRSATNKQRAVRMALVAAGGVAASGEGRLPGYSNYFIGSDPRQWHRNIPHYGQVRFHNIYSGVDLVYYGNRGRLEHDFLVSPGADPEQIRWRFDGAEKLEVNGSGALIVHLAEGELQMDP